MRKKQIGFFGGTFDPVHFGHINLALELMERCALDRVFFCPAFLSPHKQDTPPAASARQRLDMVGLAIREIQGFEALDWEVKEQKTSYTISTLQRLKNQYPKDDIHLLLAQDTLFSLPSWKDFTKILEIAPPLIGLRDSAKVEIPFEIKGKVKNNLIPTRQLHISSTFVRKRLKKKLYCGHLVPKQVLDYIYQHQLY